MDRFIKTNAFSPNKKKDKYVQYDFHHQEEKFIQYYIYISKTTICLYSLLNQKN